MDAFVDESIRGQTYFLCAVIVPFEHQALLRQELREIARVAGRRRIHSNSSSSQVREELLRRAARYVSQAIVVTSRVEQGRNEEVSRQKNLSSLVKELQKRQVGRIVIEGRSDNRLDAATILRTRANGSVIDFIHLTPEADELLWVADVVVWSTGAGTRWKQELSKISITYKKA